MTGLARLASDGEVWSSNSEAIKLTKNTPVLTSRSDIMREKGESSLSAGGCQCPVSSSAQLISVNISPAESDLTSCHSFTSKYNKTTPPSWRKYIVDKKVFINIVSPLLCDQSTVVSESFPRKESGWLEQNNINVIVNSKNIMLCFLLHNLMPSKTDQLFSSYQLPSLLTSPHLSFQY